MFKNLRIYEFADGFRLPDADQLEDALSARGFEPCGRMEPERFGWVPPDGGHALAYEVQGAVLLCLHEEKKILPASVVRRKIDERAAEIESRELRQLNRKDRLRLRDEVYYDLLPQALTKIGRTHAFIDTRNDLLVVDAATWNKAEEVAEILRDCLGSLPIVPIQTNSNPQAIMNLWITNGPPEGVELGDRAILIDPQTEGRQVSYKRQHLGSDEVQRHILSGMRPKELAIATEHEQFRLSADLGVKGFTRLDCDADATDDDSPAARFQAECVLTVDDVHRVVTLLRKVFGSEKPSTMQS